jgi:hypothetical protein
MAIVTGVRLAVFTVTSMDGSGACGGVDFSMAGGGAVSRETAGGLTGGLSMRTTQVTGAGDGAGTFDGREASWMEIETVSVALAGDDSTVITAI